MESPSTTSYAYVGYASAASCACACVSSSDAFLDHWPYELCLNTCSKYLSSDFATLAYESQEQEHNTPSNPAKTHPLGPNKALPTRMTVAPSSTAISKSPDIPILISGGIPPKLSGNCAKALSARLYNLR